MLSLKRINTDADFDAIGTEWNTLLKESGSDCVFLTHEWLGSWGKHLSGNRKLYILTARDGEKLIGVLPVAQRPVSYARMTPRTLEFLGSGVIGSDYLDVI